MNHISQNILREVLLEYMETEAAQAPPTEELIHEHTFSEQFLKKMKLLLAQEEGTGLGAESEGAAKQGKNSAKSVLFRRISQNRVSLRVAAACIACVIVFGAGMMIYRGAGGLTSSDSSATDMVATDSEEAATEETTTDTAEESAAGKDADDEDLQSGAGSESTDSDDTAQAETDLPDLDVTVRSYTAYSMELVLTNGTGAEIYYGSYYTIEVYDEDSGTWEAAEQWRDGVFEDLAYIVEDGDTVTLTVDWSDIYGELEEGTWRLTKGVQSSDEEFYTLTVVFEI